MCSEMPRTTNRVKWCHCDEKLFRVTFREISKQSKDIFKLLDRGISSCYISISKLKGSIVTIKRERFSTGWNIYCTIGVTTPIKETKEFIQPPRSANMWWMKFTNVSPKPQLVYSCTYMVRLKMVRLKFFSGRLVNCYFILAESKRLFSSWGNIMPAKGQKTSSTLSQQDQFSVILLWSTPRRFGWSRGHILQGKG